MAGKVVFMYKRILILGDAGRGKSTFAKKLGEKTGIPVYSTDDFYWKVKFTEQNDKKESTDLINKVYENTEWIVEGGTRHLIQNALLKAEVIYNLEFKNIFSQYYFLITRSLGRKHERWIDLWKLLKHVTYKRYKKEYGNHLPPIKDMLKPYMNKVIAFHSLKQINKHVSDLV